MGNAIIWAAVLGAAGITALWALVVTILQVIRMERDRREFMARECRKREMRQEAEYKARFWRSQAEIDRDFDRVR